MKQLVRLHLTAQGGELTLGVPGPEGKLPIFMITRRFRKVPETFSWDDHIALAGCQHKQNEELIQLAKCFKKKEKLKKKAFSGETDSISGLPLFL